MSEFRLLLTCEHGGNRVPDAYRDVFAGQDELLRSHRGWDPGALSLARHLARVSGAPLRHTTVTRLLVDPNRSPGNETLFSELTWSLPEAERRRIMTRYHRPYWTRVRRLTEAWLAEGAVVLHLGVHTFTPVLDGVPRTVELGVLYDPGRSREVAVADVLMRELERRLPDLRVGRNVPYHGTADGLTTSLRRRLAHPDYLGLEIEVSQGIATGPDGPRSRVTRAVGEALLAVLERGAPRKG